MFRAQVLRAKSEAIGGARRKVLHEHIGAFEQTGQHILGFRAFQIEGQRFLRPVQPDEMAREPMHGGVVRAREVAVDRPLDLDDPRPQVCQLPCGKRHGHGLFHGDHRDPVEW